MSSEIREVDNLILPILKQIGCKIPSKITSITKFDFEILVLAVICLLQKIVPKKCPTFPKDFSNISSATRFRLCKDLSVICRSLGCKEELLGFQKFMYSTEEHRRELLIWLVSKLPRHEEVQESSSDTIAESLSHNVQHSLLKWQKVKWKPPPPSLHVFDSDLSYSFSSVPLYVPGTNLSSERQHYSEKYLPFVSMQPYSSSQVIPSLIEHATIDTINVSDALGMNHWDESEMRLQKEKFHTRIATCFKNHSESLNEINTDIRHYIPDQVLFGKIYKNQENQKKVKESFVTDTEKEENIELSNEDEISSKMDSKMEQEPEPKESEEDRIRRERGEILAGIQNDIDKCVNEITEFHSMIETASESQKQLENNLKNQNLLLQDLKEEYSIRKSVLAFLPEAETNIVKLRDLCSKSSQKLVDLAKQWEVHRVALILEYRGLCKERHGMKEAARAKAEEIKQMREEMKLFTDELRARDEKYKAYTEELKQLAPIATDRQIYITRIMDMVSKVARHESAIRSVLGDISVERKKSNKLSGAAERSFVLADEVIFEATLARSGRKDEKAIQAYRYLVQLRDKFEELLGYAEKVGATKRSAREQESKFYKAKLQTGGSQTLLNDISQVQKEIDYLKNRFEVLKKSINI